LKEAGHNVLAVDTFRGVLSDVEVQALLSKGIVLLFLGLIPFAKVASAQDPNAIDQVVVTGFGESLTSPDLFSVDRRFLEFRVLLPPIRRINTTLAAPPISKTFSPTYLVS
jgi:hypothetical protein